MNRVKILSFCRAAIEELSSRHEKELSDNRQRLEHEVTDIRCKFLQSQQVRDVTGSVYSHSVLANYSCER